MALSVSEGPGLGPIWVTDISHQQANPLASLPRPVGVALTDPGCALFEFVLKVGLVGTLCLLGFIGNTLSFAVLWRERGGQGGLTFLLQAVLLADLAVVWMLFIRDVVPGLGYILPLLHDCSTVCSHVAAVTRPLLFLARACSVWLLLHMAVSRYLTLARPAAPIASIDCARKQVVLTLLTAFVFSVPLTFDSVLHVVSHPGLDQPTLVEPLYHNRWYRMVYLYVVQFALVLLAPVLVTAYLCGRLVGVLRAARRLRRPTIHHPTHPSSLDATQLVLTLAITLVVCYLPIITLFILEWAWQESSPRCGHLLYYLQDFANMFLALNSAIKLLILTLFAERFSKGLRAVFCRPSSYKTINSMEAGIYKCQDMSEMTLISQVDARL